MALAIAARTPWGKALAAFTWAVLGIKAADVLGLLGSHHFASACGSLAAVSAVALNLYNGRKRRREQNLERLVVDLRGDVSCLESLAEANKSVIQGQGYTISSMGATIEGLGATVEREQTARMAMKAELDQVAEEVLRRDNILAAHSGSRVPLRWSVPAEVVDVLVVDDNALTLRSMGRLLARYGFRVELTASVALARALVAARDAACRRYDFAIFDLVMPDASIDDVIDLICEIHQGTDVVVMTGLTDEAVLDRAKDCASKVLVKPIDLDELLALLGCTPAENGP